MSITASRFGSSPVLLDWNGITSTVQNKVPEISAEKRDSYGGLWHKLLGKMHDQVSGFYNAVIDPELSQVAASQALAKKILEQKNLKNCLFIGIGGSSLGPMCLIDSLKHLSTTHIQFHFFENPDPIDWTYRIKNLNPHETFVCVVTKSGTTYETLSIFMLAYDWLKRSLGPNQAAKQTVAITDPGRGELLEFAQKENIATLAIAPSVGGRYSVFTPVGLFAASLAGLNVEQFLAGAKKIRDYCEKATPEKNLFITWTHALHSLEVTHPTHVMMPYSTPLRLLANWWVQLWAESLGKDGKGFTAIPSLGAIDQHSMLQLLRDGPNNKVIWFVNVQDFKVKVPVPSLNFKVKSFDLLEGQELGSILDTEFRAVQKVMTNQKRPHLQIQLDSISEESMGACFFIFSMLTAYMGEVLHVNPFDQPGVEEGKVYIRETLVRKKAEALAQPESTDEVHRLRLHRE
jgi:glucose-6-phosphate isomerase